MEKVFPGQQFFNFLLFLFLITGLLFPKSAAGQVGGITTIYTDYKGFWSSSSNAISNIQPDNDHNLLGFYWRNSNYSTGVNDAKLTANGISFKPVVFQAFPVRNVTLTDPSRIILGQLKDGVDNGKSTPQPFTLPPKIGNFLTDGPRGLNIGTGVIDVPKSSPLTFDFGAIIDVNQINDGTPDLLVTQVGNVGGRGTVPDNIYFIDGQGNQVGNVVTIDHTKLDAVGNWLADLYSIDGSLPSNYTKTSREIRVWAADVSSFGINSTNYTRVTALVYELQGYSDPAFLAFNTAIIQVLSANDDAATTNIGTPVAIRVLDNDVPSSAIDETSVVPTSPRNGTVTVSQTGVITYTPNANFYGTDVFSYTVSNKAGTQSADAQVTVTVGGPVATPVFDAGLTSSRCMGAGQNSYTATATNSTGISYALSPAAAGSIDASSGLVTWSATFSGTATITATASGQNGPKSATYTVTVNPNPSVTSAASETICSNMAQNYTITSDVSSATFSWSRAEVSGISNAAVSNQTSNTITETLVNTTSAPVNVIYTIVPQANGCTGTTFSYTVTVNPTPTVASSSATICNNTAQNYTISSNISNATFSWSRAAVSGISNPGVNNQTSNTITETLLNTTSAPVTVTYLITPTANGCIGNTSSYAVTVNPTPAVTSAASGTICSNTAQDYTITSNVSGATFSWSRDAVAGISNAAVSNQTGNQIAETLINTTSAPVDVTYTIIPQANDCTDDAFTYKVTVDPKPAVSSRTSKTICNNTPLNYTITSNMSNATFNWSRAAVQGVSNAAVSNQTSTTITETLVNTTSNPITVNYVIIPQANSCTGDAFTFQVTVNPVTNAPVAAGATICAGDKATLTATAPGGTYNWYSSASGGNALATNASFTTPNLTNTTTYYVDVTSAEGCTSARTPVTVTVNPTADPSFNYSSNTYCKTGANPVPARASDGTFSATPSGLIFADNHTGEINLSASSTGSYTIKFVTNTTCVYSSTANITITNGPDATFSYSGPYCQKQLNPLPIFPQGSVAGVFSSADAGIIFVNSNTGEIDLQQSLPGTYTIRNDIAAANGCAATFATTTVTINAVPTVNAGLDQEVCSGQTVLLNGSIGGSASSATWSGGTGTFSNPASLQTVYTLGPNETNVTLFLTTNDPAGPCGAAADEVHIIVNPTPKITSNQSNIICNNTPQSYTINSNVSDATFSWSRAAVGGISNPAVSNETSSTITESLVNTTSSAITVIYTIIPKTNTCTGNTFNYTVTVNPTPTITSEASTVICNQTAQNYNITSNVNDATFSWSRAAVEGISNPAVRNQTNSTIKEALINTTSSPISVFYNIIPEANGCTGNAFIYKVTVNPTPIITSEANNIICNQTPQNYNITSNVSDATFNWSRAKTEGISNDAVSNQTSSTITETLNNTTANPISVTYTIIPKTITCTGTAFNYTVIVNPTPTITSEANNVICNRTAQNYTITSNVNHATFIWSRAKVEGISNDAVNNQASNAITETLVNTTANPIAVTYTIIPETNSCNGTPFQYQVTVKPTPVLSNTSLNQIVCSGERSVPVTLTSNVNGANFTWIATATPGITNFATSGADAIPAQILMNTGSSAGTITYTIKSFYNGCAGESSIYTITVNPKPATPVVSSNSPLCTGTTLNLTTPAVDGATYSWLGPNGFISNLQNPEISNVTSLANGNYLLTVTVNGCTSDAGTTSVIVNSIPATPTAGSNGPVCAGEMLNLMASTVTGATYSWSGPNGFSSTLQNPVIDHATVTASGTYAVTVTVNGCTSAARTINVVVNPIPAAPAASSNSPICATTTLNLIASNISGATYSWTGPNGFTSTLQNPVISSATTENSGTYYVTASVNGCSSSPAFITVVVNPAPAAPVLSSNSPVCSGSAIAISCTAYDGATYLWNGPNGYTSNQQNPVINNASILNEGRYTVLITTPNCGVTNTAFIDVKVNPKPAAPVVSSNGPVCIGQTLKLSATSISGAVYSWTGPNGFSSNLQNPEITNIDVNQAGTYTVTATVNACSSAAGITKVTVNTPSVVMAGNDRILCSANPIVTLAGSITGSSTTGIWSTSGSGTFVAGNTSLTGTYLASAADIANGNVTLTLTAINTSPCNIASSSFKVTFTPTPVVSAGDDQQVCINDEVSLNGKILNSTSGTWTSSGSGTFRPSNNSLDAHYIPSDQDRKAGNITLTFSAAGTCMASDQMKVYFVPMPKVNAGADLYLLQGEKMTLQPGVSGIDLKYNWTPNLYLSDNTSKNPLLTATEDMTYTLTVTTVGGCAAQDQIFIKVLKPVTIPNTFTPNGDGINDTWVIKDLEDYPEATVKIFNRYGIQLFYSQGYGTPWNGSFNGQQLPVGTYYYIIDLKTYGKIRSGYVSIIR